MPACPEETPALWAGSVIVLGQYGKGLVHCEPVLGEAIREKIERLKWSLWHGQVDKALGKINDLETSTQPFSETYARYAGLVEALSELRTYIVNNRHLIPNYSERYHNGEAISTGFCGVNGERSGEPPVLQEATNAVVERRSPLVVTDASAGAQRGAERHF